MHLLLYCLCILQSHIILFRELKINHFERFGRKTLFKLFKIEIECVKLKVAAQRTYREHAYKGVPKLTQDLNLIENTVFSIDYVIFLLNYKVHRIGLFVE